jgi:hypothetical protein
MVVGIMQTCQAVILILPLLFLARRLSVPRRWAALTPFAVLPVAYFFYFYHDARFYVELVPFFMLITAGFAAELVRRDRLVVAPLVGFAIWAAVASGGQFSRERRVSESQLAYFHDVESLRKVHGRLLVFAHDDTAGTASDSGDELFTMLYWYNTQSFNGDVVVVRDVARLRPLAMACFPSRLPVVVSGGMSPAGDGLFRAATVNILGRPATEGACPGSRRLGGVVTEGHGRPVQPTSGAAGGTLEGRSGTRLMHV